MKIGITAGFVNENTRWGTDHYKKLKEQGYDVVDFQLADTDAPVYTMSDAELRNITAREKKLVSEAGLEIYQAHGPWRYPPMDYTAEDRAERMEKMKKSIYITSLLECPNWIVHPLMPFGLEDAGTEAALKTWDINVEFMSELVKTAKDCGVTICLENMPFLKFSVSRPEDILRMVKTVNDDNFKICLDTGHVAVFNDLSVGDEVRRVGSEIRAFHVHDNKLSEDLHLWPFFGVIDWEDFGKSLRDIDYKLPVSLEANRPWKVSDPMLEHMSKTLNMLMREILEQ